LKPDILSVNEIQYDLPKVPNNNYSSMGNNSNLFAKDIRNNTLAYSIFYPANTGFNALRNSKNEYVRNPNKEEVQKYSDGINFGMFPGQYSTAGLTKYKIPSIKVISKISWKQFNPLIDFSFYADEKEKPLPKNMPLFDKNFTDSTLLIEGHKVHLILLHTVPSYAFGNPKSPNFARNRDQLLFLKWYLGGTVKFVSNKLMIHPLQNGVSFIALGDWNADINERTESSDVLKTLGKLFHYANDHKAPTYRGMDIFKDSLLLHLDCILLSNDIGVKKHGIFAPTPNFKKLACQNKIATRDHFVLVKRNEEQKVCHYLVEKNYYYSKMASDHLAIWADIYFKHT